MSAARKAAAAVDTLPIPEAALAAHIACLGKTGSGKTSTTKVIIENRVAQGHRVCVLDPIKSDWWGLTSSADGKRPGLPFTILGGPRGHAPLPPKSGKVLAELVASGKLPLSILDMAEFGMGQHPAFFSDFAETLFRKIRGVVYLVVEEAHIFAPKETGAVSGENLAIYWAKMLATGGRSKGIRLIVATQRTQALHNAVLGSCETAIIHRFTLPADQAPVRTWLKGNVTDPAIVKRIDTGMSSIPTGSAWVCAGEQKVFEFVAWPRIATFDNSATPDKDADTLKVKTAPVDLDALKDLMGAAVAEISANDPKALKAEVARLTRELAAAQKHPAAAPAAKAIAGPSPEQVAKLQDEARRAGFLEGAQSREPDVQAAFVEGADAMLARLQESAGAARAKLVPPKPKARAQLASPMRDVTPRPAAQRGPVAPPPAQPRQSRPAPAPAAPGDAGGPNAGQRRILEAVLFWEAMGIEQPTRVQVASACAMTAAGGTFKAYAGKLVSAGLLVAPMTGRVQITDEGRAVAPEPDLSVTARARLGQILNAGQQRILDAMPQDGSEIGRAELAQAAGMDHTGGTFKAYMGKLVSLGIASAPRTGMVAVEAWVWD